MHFHPMRANYGFEHMELPMEYYRERHRHAHEGLPKEHGVGENELTPVISTVDETHSLTHWTIRRAIDFLEARDTTRPFFLWTSFTKPHPPWDPCANYWALYQNRAVPAPAYGDWSATPGQIAPIFMRPTYRVHQFGRMSAEQIADARRAYYACITQIDYQLGLLFGRMREMRLLTNTWIIFTSDHGEMLGDHHLSAKTVFLEGSAHIPLLIRPPTEPGAILPMAGAQVDTLVNLADIMPTVLNIARVPLPADHDGIDLLPLVDKPAEREFYGVSQNTHYCLIRGDFKYIWASAGGPELLFNLRDDPMELHNLAGAAPATGVLDAMRAGLVARMQAHGSACAVNGRLQPLPAAGGPRSVSRWPGFHTTVIESDVLH